MLAGELGSERARVGAVRPGAHQIFGGLDQVQRAAALACRADELSYLANVLVAGCSVDARRLRPLEAFELATQAVSAGLELCCAKPDDLAQATRALRQFPCDGLLRLAFRRAAEPEPKQAGNTSREGLAAVRRLLKAMQV